MQAICILFILLENADYFKNVLKKKKEKRKVSLWSVCIWAHSSWRSLVNRRPWQNLLSCHHRIESWSRRRTLHQVWSCTFWQASPWFQSWGLLLFQGAGHPKPMKESRQLFKHQNIMYSLTTRLFNLLPFASSEASGLSWTSESWVWHCRSENTRQTDYGARTQLQGIRLYSWEN